MNSIRRSAAAGLHPREVLVVDDDPALLKALGRGLGLYGFASRLAHDASEALDYLDEQAPDVIILDVMLPQMDGISLCHLIRERHNTPILMLTSRDAVSDRVAGLKAGADDYLVKPFAFEELLARIEALLRRGSSSAESLDELKFADLTLDRKNWTVKRGEENIVLTAREFRVLEHFLLSPNTVLTRDHLLQAIWGESSTVESNVVDVHIANLRLKLEATGRGRLIHTIRGAGYILR